jgi:Rieske Fe-S protein
MDEDRRKFCQATCAAVCAAALPIPLAGCKSGGNSGDDIWTLTAFKAGDVMADMALIAQVADTRDGGTGISHNFYIGRDAGGLFAMDANCTHARCVLEFDPANPAMNIPNPRFICNCHGSTFDFVGQNPTPPAPSPLAHYQLTVEGDGTLVVDASIVVDPSTRTPG